jgi:hypothetical protein
MARTVSLGSIRIKKTRKVSFNPFKTITVGKVRSRKTPLLKLRKKRI